MKYAYETYSPEQFEDLIVAICRRLLGMSAQGFAKGPDGGRDAKFEGTAELIPSKSAPWKGITIVQAKHTNGYNKHYGDLDFFNPETKSNTIAKELGRIKNLYSQGKLNNYMLFANRRLTETTSKK